MSKPMSQRVTQATSIAIIQYFKVQQGYGLAPLLGISDQHDNFYAVLEWVTKQSKSDGVVYLDSKPLRRRFRDCLAEHGYYFEDLVFVD